MCGRRPVLRNEQKHTGSIVKVVQAAAMLAMFAILRPDAVTAQDESAVFVVPRPLVVVARKDLRFGNVHPGIASRILTTDVRYAGLFEINGSKRKTVRIEFHLPESLTSDDGHDLQVSFGPGDGSVADDRGRFHGAGFDPNQPIVATLGPNGKLYIKLGGTVHPVTGQPGGSYRATIFLSVYDLGS